MKRSILAMVLCAVAVTAGADEGMWLFTDPPAAQMKQRYGFEASSAWLEHLQKASVRFNNGGSASFVSPDGLIITNHHVGSDCLAKASTKERDLIRNGFRAHNRGEEIKCADLEINVLQSIENVTDRVNGAVTPGMSNADAEKARRGVMNGIEKESTEKTGLRSDVITLFQGGQYHLYRYKKYTDVRIVFAPEERIAFFGGDPDNFEYPRYDLDIAFFRAYENDKAVKSDSFLKFNPGVKEGDMVFTSGNPGSTERLNTVAHLEFIRDVRLPLSLATLKRREVALKAWAARSAENARRANDDLRSIENSRKALSGQLEGLQDPTIMKAKADAELALRYAVGSDPKLAAAYGSAWQDVSDAVRQQRLEHVERTMIANGSLNSPTLGIARTIVRYVEETPKPNGERLREFRDSNLESLREELYSEAPIYSDLETVKLADTLGQLLELMPNDPLVRQILGGKSPQARASELVRGTKLAEAAQRKALIEGGKAAVAASTDPMILLARVMDTRGRELRTSYEQKVQEPLRQAYAKIANARFKSASGDNYPDATFTLRLSYGKVAGYTDAAGTKVPAVVDIAGLYARASEHGNAEPFELPKSWLDRKTKVKMSTPFNFITTNDIIGGNSGSPVVDRNGDFVGIVFDMNLPSLVYNFGYQERDGRMVATHAAGILEALKNVYGASEVLGELKVK
jgi:hypothetical protein